MKKPCIVYVYCGLYFAWDEHGRKIASRTSYFGIREAVHEYGYEIQPPNSAFAVGVRDRMRALYPSLCDNIERAVR